MMYTNISKERADIICPATEPAPRTSNLGHARPVGSIAYLFINGTTKRATTKVNHNVIVPEWRFNYVVELQLLYSLVTTTGTFQRRFRIAGALKSVRRLDTRPTVTPHQPRPVRTYLRRRPRPPPPRPRSSSLSAAGQTSHTSPHCPCIMLPACLRASCRPGRRAARRSRCLRRWLPSGGRRG